MILTVFLSFVESSVDPQSESVVLHAHFSNMQMSELVEFVGHEKAKTSREVRRFCVTDAFRSLDRHRYHAFGIATWRGTLIGGWLSGRISVARRMKKGAVRQKKTAPVTASGGAASVGKRGTGMRGMVQA